jgi:hypothetical protein
MHVDYLTLSWLVEIIVRGHVNEIHTNTAAVIQARTRILFGMLGRTIVHASRFGRKFDFGTRSGITLVHSWYIVFRPMYGKILVNAWNECQRVSKLLSESISSSKLTGGHTCGTTNKHEFFHTCLEDALVNSN